MPELCHTLIIAKRWAKYTPSKKILCLIILSGVERWKNGTLQKTSILTELNTIVTMVTTPVISAQYGQDTEITLIT